MVEPRRHHYLPEFYQKNWAIQGKCKVYRRYGTKVSVVSRAPKAVGFELDLYATAPVEDVDRHLLERVILSRIDNDAARALRFLLKNDGAPSDPRLFHAWTRFLLSLLHRAPSRIRDIRQSLDIKTQEIINDLRSKYPELRDSRERDLINAQTVETAYQGLIHDLLTSTVLGPVIHDMSWSIISPPDRSFTFLTSDRPLIRSDALGKRSSFLILPVGPKRLFVACADKRVSDWLAKLTPKKLMETMNDIVVRQAERFVLASDEAQSRFVENRLMVPGKAPSRDPSGEITWTFPGLFEPWELQG